MNSTRTHLAPVVLFAIAPLATPACWPGDLLVPAASPDAFVPPYAIDAAPLPDPTAPPDAPCPRTRCGARCVDPRTDSDHCGACDLACPAGADCVGGVCACPPGHTKCGGVCRPTGAPCSVGVGTCRRAGTLTCAQGGTACSAVAPPPTREILNGLDDDCDGEVDEDFGIWHLPAGARRWSTYPLDVVAASDPSQRARHAPTEPIRAAFDVESLRVVYVLTETSWHVLDLDVARWGLPDGQWTHSGAIVGTFPMSTAIVQRFWASGVLYAYSVPANVVGGDGVHESVEVVTRAGVIRYNLALASRAITVGEDPVAALDVRWAPPYAPSYLAVRGAWIDLDNVNGWVRGTPAAICGDAGIPAPGITAHGVSVTADRVHVMEAGHCFRFFSAEPTESFPPFNAAMFPGAPPAAVIGDVAYNQRALWVFRAP